MIGREEIAAAAARIAPHVRRTPVLWLEPGALGPGAVALKLEQLQATGSFKVRGAFNTLLSAPIPAAGVVAASGGNHGAAVAYAAGQLGVSATVFVPEVLATAEKLERMRGYGAELKVIGGSVPEVWAAFHAHAEATGALPVHPYDAAPTLAGQGTVAAEIEAQAPEIDTLLVSVGGGGLIGGILGWYGGAVRVIAVETEGTATLAKALDAGRESEIRPTGLAASALGAASIGALPFEAITAHLAGNLLVADIDVTAAARRLWQAARIACEPGAATALAALTSGAYSPRPDERVGVLVCGANAAPDWFLPAGGEEAG